jgi:uncharacterized protein (DUF342 family)
VTSVTAFLHISPDRLWASLAPTGSPEETVTFASGEALRQLLAARGIVHGLDQEAIDRATLSVSGTVPLGPLLLARGVPPAAGYADLQPCLRPVLLTFEAYDADGHPLRTEIHLVPLVGPGDLLAESGPPSPPEAGIDIFGAEIPCPSRIEHTIVAGDNALLDATGQQLTATTWGYPAFSAGRKGEQLRLGVEPLIRLTPDRMQAQLCLNPAPPGHNLPEPSTILQILDAMGIVSGRLPQAIDHCLEQCCRTQRPQTGVIALGVLPVRGKDAWLRFAIEIGPLPGKVMGNGEIDYRERNMFIGVNKDQLIAVRVPPTPGSPGRDIFGTAIAQMPGKDLALKVTDDAAFDPATGEIRASRSGVLSLVSENSVKVCARQIISRDIDFTTGNIVSRDALEIRGSVRPKFRVNALGDILVRGNIEKAQIRSDSNVVVQGGMVGDFAVIRSRGDVDIQFVERGRIYAGGTVLVRRSGYYCRIHAGANLHGEPAARFMASQLVAAGSLTVGTVGSDNAEPSLLAAAVSPEQLQRWFELRRTLAAQSGAIDALQHRMGAEADSEELDELKAEHEQSRQQFADLNLIVPKDLEPQDQGLSHALACTLVVRGKVFAGTEIRIGNSRMTLPVTQNNVCFRLRDHILPGASSRDILILANKK